MFGSVCVVCSILLLLFKHEHNRKKFHRKDSSEFIDNSLSNTTSVGLSIVNTYKLIWNILRLPPMKMLIFVLFTIRVSFFFDHPFWKLLFNKTEICHFFVVVFKVCFSSENVGRLKLIEYGVARENLSLLTAFISPMLLIVPFLLRKFINGPNPLEFLKIAYCFACVHQYFKINTICFLNL